MREKAIVFFFFLTIAFTLVTPGTLPRADETAQTPAEATPPMTWPPSDMPPPPRDALKFYMWAQEQAHQRLLTAGTDMSKRMEEYRFQCEEFFPQALQHQPVPGQITIGTPGYLIEQLRSQTCNSYQAIKTNQPGVMAYEKYEAEKAAHIEKWNSDKLARENSPEGIMSRACRDKDNIEVYKREIADEHVIGNRSGFVDARTLDDNASEITILEKELQDLKRQYKTVTGKAIDFSRCSEVASYDTNPPIATMPSVSTWPPANVSSPPPTDPIMYMAWVGEQAGRSKMTAAWNDVPKQMEIARFNCEEFIPLAIKNAPTGSPDMEWIRNSYCDSYNSLKKVTDNASAEEARQNSPEGIMNRLCENKARIASLKQEIANERKVGAQSGYVNKVILHDNAAAILDLEREIEALKKQYKQVTGKFPNLSQCSD